jgi:hypothetical protein
MISESEDRPSGRPFSKYRSHEIFIFQHAAQVPQDYHAWPSCSANIYSEQHTVLT